LQAINKFKNFEAHKISNHADLIENINKTVIPKKKKGSSRRSPKKLHAAEK